jgi:hypothetical protein
MIGETWFPGLTLKTLLNWDLYWKEFTLYIKIEALLKHYYMYSTIFIEITKSVAYSIASSTKQRNGISRICYKQMIITPKL